MRRLVTDERGVIDRLMAMVITFALAFTVMAFSAVLAYTFAVHSADQTLADHAALQLAAGANPSAVLQAGSVPVGSLTSLKACTSSECYYAPPCPVGGACVVYVNQPIHAFGGTFVVLSKGVAPWQG
jgi:hypothetical protein